MMRLVHYSSQEVKEVHAIEQKPDDFKPRGFWVSDDDCEHNWYWWCVAERFNLSALTHVHAVEVTENARLLTLSSPEEIDQFTEMFQRPVSAKAYIDIFKIDWNQVRSRYDGLIITPYIWSRRMELMWYYSWDCASGCIWNPDVVRIQLIEVREPVQVTEEDDE